MLASWLCQTVKTAKCWLIFLPDNEDYIAGVAGFADMLMTRLLASVFWRK